MEKLTILNDIKNFLGDHISLEELELDADIFKTGYVNSLFAMKLVQFVEGNFNIKVENEDLEITNFSTVNNLTNFIINKLAAQNKK